MISQLASNNCTAPSCIDVKLNHPVPGFGALNVNVFNVQSITYWSVSNLILLKIAITESILVGLIPRTNVLVVPSTKYFLLVITGDVSTGCVYTLIPIDSLICPGMHSSGAGLLIGFKNPSSIIPVRCLVLVEPPSRIISLGVIPNAVV